MIVIRLTQLAAKTDLFLWPILFFQVVEEKERSREDLPVAYFTSGFVVCTVLPDFLNSS